jgi:hypothetical protein
MRNRMLSQMGLVALLGLSVLTGGGSSGCSEADPINRVQPDYIRKADLVGPNRAAPYEWYIRNTVVDTGRSASFAFPGLQDELKRVRWDIEENRLIARRAYEMVSGSDGKGADPSKNDGVIVASYPILEHFDVRREYNPSTGEETNVISPNMDRAWFDRDYIRVDWGRNEASDPEGLFWFDKIFGDVVFQPTGYVENDPKSANRPTYLTDKGYLDVTTKMAARHEDFFGIKGLPACYIANLYTGSDVMECNEQEISVRTSMMRVDSDRVHDYEALETNSEKWAMFGTFNRDRFGFSRQYELLDKNWHRLVARHNIWKKSHANDQDCYTGDRAESDTKCESSVGKGSRCDLFASDAKKGLCTIPLKDREVRAVAYYVSTNMPADLWDTNKVIVAQWNDAMVNAVAVGREVECRKGGGDADSCRSQFFDGDSPKASNGPAVVLCHNPVLAGDFETCGAVGTVAREGDMRYNLIAWVDQPLAAAPLGYGPDGADPLTGEVVTATSYIYGASLDSFAVMARDMVKVAAGAITPFDFASGTHVSGGLGEYNPTNPKVSGLYDAYGDYLAGRRADVVVREGKSADEIKAAHAAVDAREVAARIGASGVRDGMSATDRLSAVQGAIASRGVEGRAGFGGRAEAEARSRSISDRVQGTSTELQLIGSTDWMNANALPLPVSFNPGGGELGVKAAYEQTRKMSSPFGGQLSPFAVQGLRSKMNAVLESRGECMFSTDEFNAPHLEGLAKKMIAKYPNLKDDKGESQALFMELRALIYKAVTEHEIGHTMSMRHNFQGSWDSVNYHPNYWKLRTKDGAAQNECAQPRGDQSPDNCMGPRYLDPETPDEAGVTGAHPGIEEYAYSSIMDYGYDFNTDLVGLGSYDKAMMKFVYGNAVETFVKGSAVGERMASLNAIPGQTTPRGPLSEQWWVKRSDPKIPGGDQVQPTHYTTMAREMQKEKLLFDPSRCRAPKAELGEEYAAIGGQVCDGPKKDHAHVSELVGGDIPGAGVKGNLFKTEDGRIRWPYRFGTDEYASYPHNLRFDAGADVYEGALNLAKLYEYRYILDFYRRGRRGWMGAIFGGGRMWDRYFSRMHSIGWLSANRIGTYQAMFNPSGSTTVVNPALNSVDWGEGYVLASKVMFDAIERSVMRVQPGEYGLKASSIAVARPVAEVPDFNAPARALATVDVLNGRYIDEDLNNTKGGSFHYQSFHERLGTHAEKPYAMIALFAQFPPMDVYYSRDTYLDGRNMMLNFRSIFPKGYDRLIAGIMANDTDVSAPYTVNQGTTVQYADLTSDTFTYPAGATLLDPLVGYRLQVPAFIVGMLYGQDDSSRTFQSSAQVWIEGSPEGATLQDVDKDYFFETDAQGGSGVLWAARNLGTQNTAGLTRPNGIGHRMIAQANKLLAGAFAMQTNADGTAKYDAAKRPLWEAGKEGQTRGNADALTAYKRYVGLLNVVRNVMWDMGEGSINGIPR